MHKPIQVIKAAIRDSRLARLQAKELFALLPQLKYELITMQSFGDKNKHIVPTDDIDADFFTRELDRAVLNGEADIAVHSAKDIPYPLPAGLEVYCLTEAADKTDALVDKNNRKLSELPAGARVGASSQSRRDKLLALRPDAVAVSIRGTIEERLSQIDSGHIDALIVATCALQRLGLSHRIAEILPFKTHALQGNLAVVGRKGEAEIKAVFAPFDIRNAYGKVTLTGFGPGNPDLLTIGGNRALCEADVIFYDYLVDHDFLNKYKAEKIYVGKRKGQHSLEQDAINEYVYQAAISGKNTVRLKGGDPMIFAHGREEIDFLQSRFVETRVIPGISAGVAAAASTHIPFTHRGLSSSVAFVSGHAGAAAPIPNTDTLVYYMSGAHVAAIATQIIAARGENLPAALVYNVSLLNQRTFFSSLKELQYSVIKYPAPVLFIAGKAVGLESGHADAPNVLAIGTNAEAYLNNKNIVHTPLIKIQKNDKCILPEITIFDWVIFTSRHGVRYFFEMQPDVRLANIKIASIGKTTTAELNKFNISPEMESANGCSEGIVEYFREHSIIGKKILLPRSAKGMKSLPEELSALSNEVADVPVYTNIVNEKAEKVDLSRFDKIMFTSPSCVDAFLQIYGALPAGIQMVASGNTTFDRLKSALDETV